jgi:ubiquinone/menaquinone biosynthesis C-methylase UbiE
MGGVTLPDAVGENGAAGCRRPPRSVAAAPSASARQFRAPPIGTRLGRPAIVKRPLLTVIAAIYRKNGWVAEDSDWDTEESLPSDVVAARKRKMSRFRNGDFRTPMADGAASLWRRPRLAPSGVDSGALNAAYLRAMSNDLFTEYNEGSGFANLGFWGDGTTTQKEACETLMEQLLALLPDKKGRILDVACGRGATTRHLLRYFDARNVTGINISPEQLEHCLANAPGCAFHVMDAANLKFEDHSFDNIVCVEAAFHFNTREKFLNEALRVLKPGGRLILSDILMTRQGEAAARYRNPANFIEDLPSYDGLLKRVGFTSTRVIDVTEPCADRYFSHLFAFLLEKFEKKQIEKSLYVGAMRQHLWFMGATRFYILAHTQKPMEKRRGATV